MLIIVGQEMCLKCRLLLLTLCTVLDLPRSQVRCTAGLSCCAGRFSRQALVPWRKIRASRHCRRGSNEIPPSLLGEGESKGSLPGDSVTCGSLRCWC